MGLKTFTGCALLSCLAFSQPKPASFSSWDSARICSAMAKYLPGDGKLTALSNGIERVSNQVRLYDLVLTGASNEAILRASSASLARWENAGKAVVEVFALEKAVLSKAFIDGAFEAVRGARLPGSAALRPEGAPDAPGSEGQESPRSPLSPELEAMLREYLAAPFDAQSRLTLDPVAHTLLLEPSRLTWGSSVTVGMRMLLDRFAGTDLDGVAPSQWKLLGLRGGSRGLMAAPEGNEPGMREASGRFVFEAKQVELRPFLEKLKIENPMVLGAIAHPLFPARPNIRLEIQGALDRERRTAELMPLVFELAPGFELRVELAMSSFPFGSLAGVSNAAEAKAKAGGDVERLSIRFTDTGALALALGIGGAFMNQKPEMARLQLLAMMDQLAVPAQGRKPLPPALLAGLKDFVAGKRRAITLRLKEKAPLDRLGSSSGSLLDFFNVE